MEVFHCHPTLKFVVLAAYESSGVSLFSAGRRFGNLGETHFIVRKVTSAVRAAGVVGRDGRRAHGCLHLQSDVPHLPDVPTSVWPH